VAALPGLAAVVALVFTSLAIRETDAQLKITEQGQITDRYNAAITNLGSSSVDVRLGGIYALQRMMQDSPRDQPTVVAVLCAFVRDHAKWTTVKSARSPVILSQNPHITSPRTLNRQRARPPLKPGTCEQHAYPKPSLWGLRGIA
jgi:hypothetical protein